MSTSILSFHLCILLRAILSFVSKADVDQHFVIPSVHKDILLRAILSFVSKAIMSTSILSFHWWTRTFCWPVFNYNVSVDWPLWCDVNYWSPFQQGFISVCFYRTFLEQKLVSYFVVWLNVIRQIGASQKSKKLNDQNRFSLAIAFRFYQCTTQQANQERLGFGFHTHAYCLTFTVVIVSRLSCNWIIVYIKCAENKINIMSSIC